MFASKRAERRNSVKRTAYCGEFGQEHVGKWAIANGWVAAKRDMGGVIFLDLRDREGVLQVVCNQQLLGEQFPMAEALKNESVIEVRGKIQIRDEQTYNPKLKTGTIELRAEELCILSSAGSLPFQIAEAGAVKEDLRLKYRYLDLRRESLQENLRFRHKLVRAVREFLDEDGFIEVETPILTKSTPEGARDYLVPSRVHPGAFYALPQSPQIFKQLLMVGGLDKYYQIARCFRDEDLRADRQPEFTQVDMELSFVEQEDVLQHLERMFRALMRRAMDIEIAPMPRLTWQQAMDLYGTDKPDLRFALPIIDLTKIAAKCSFGVFKSAIEAGGVVRALCIPGGASLTRSTIEQLTQKAQRLGAKGMAWIALREDGEIYSILTKYFRPEELEEIIKSADAHPGDFVLFSADKLETVRRVLGGLRLEIADILNLRRPGDFQFLLVTDFPQFGYSEQEHRYIAAHHPFTMPREEDLQYLKTAPQKVRAQAYDVVLNGTELGSGSIRIHDQAIQREMFEALGLSEDQIKEKFGFLVEAFGCGTPQHGGFAFGLDRLAMLLSGADSLRDVTAFPKTKDALCPMTLAPDYVSEEQLEVLGLGQSFGQKGGAERARTKTKVDVKKVARLSQLELSRQEEKQMEEELAVIIGFADQLAEIDTDGVPQTAHIVPNQNVFREDRARPGMPRQELLKNAPSVRDGYLLVPQVIE